jgi:hypothetical protein
MKIKTFLLSFMAILFLSSCASLQAGIYLSSVDKNIGDKILQNEPIVESFLEEILSNPEQYTITAFERRGIGMKIPRTKLLTHSYYVIKRIDSKFYTLSFYGSKIARYSEGSWALNADADMSSYLSYIQGNNQWDVLDIKTYYGIDTTQTITKILEKIHSNVTYYWRDHINDLPGMDNCNTALHETMTEWNTADHSGASKSSAIDICLFRHPKKDSHYCA